MSLSALSQANWLDLIAVILMLRITYTGSILGVGAQILPTLALCASLVVSITYYETIASNISEAAEIPLSVASFSVFFVLAYVLIVLAFIVNKFIPVKKPDKLIGMERLFGFLIGVMRSVIALGLMFISLLLLPIKGMDESVNKSASGIPVIDMNLELYAMCVNNVRIRKEMEEVRPNRIYDTLSQEKDFIFNPFGWADIPKRKRKEEWEKF